MRGPHSSKLNAICFIFSEMVFRAQKLKDGTMTKSFSTTPFRMMEHCYADNTTSSCPFH